MNVDSSAKVKTLDGANTMTQESASDWQRLFQSMLEETDARRLRDKVDALEGAIFVRYQELEFSSNSAGERSALQEATDVLFKFKTEKLGYSQRVSRWAGPAKQ
jgi:hypothetical protein